MSKVSVWGATGFAGGELLRIIGTHPKFELACAVSASSAGSPVGASHPHIRHIYRDINFVSPEVGAETECDIAFLALPHRASAERAAQLLARGIKVVDLSADFRLRSSHEYERWYGVKHPVPELLEEAVYGLPELHRDKLGNSRLASGVGCNGTSAILALLPLARSGLIRETRIECRVGSSEAGATGDAGSHHPHRSRSLRVVSSFVHRHMSELVQELEIPEQAISMTVTAVELVRGIQCLAHVTLNEKMTEPQMWKLWRAAWADEPFVSICPAKPAHMRLPDPRFVMGSNRAMVGFALADDGTRAICASAIDNLMKGAAGSAVQSANIMLGLPETMGLEMTPTYPA